MKIHPRVRKRLRGESLSGFPSRPIETVEECEKRSRREIFPPPRGRRGARFSSNFLNAWGPRAAD